MPHGESMKTSKKDSDDQRDHMTIRAERFGISVFQRETPLNKRKVYSVFGLFFAICFVAEIFPLYSVANRVEPYVLGMPFAMFWLVFLTLLQFLGLAALYCWEYRGE
jgi:hypothetical protein